MPDPCTDPDVLAAWDRWIAHRDAAEPVQKIEQEHRAVWQAARDEYADACDAMDALEGPDDPEFVDVCVRLANARDAKRQVDAEINAAWEEHCAVILSARRACVDVTNLVRERSNA